MNKLPAEYIAFFSNVEMNLYDGDIVVNFMDYLPMLKQGFADYINIYKFMHAYIKFHGLLKDGIININNNLKILYPDREQITVNDFFRKLSCDLSCLHFH